jgi:hypothetical protein
MAITVCGRSQCLPYEFGPGLDNRHLLQIADQWKTGERVVQSASTFDPMLEVAQVRFIEDADSLTAWVRTARKGNRVIYFRGEIAQFRYEAPRRLARLLAKADELPAGKSLETHERIDVATIQRQLALLEAVNHLHMANMIEMVQLRMTDGTGTVYYAAKR